MIKNYLRLTLRNLYKNRWFSAINIIGLTIGIASSLLVYAYVSYELSFDKFHADADRIYRITKTTQSGGEPEFNNNVPYPLIGALRNDFTQFSAATQYHNDEKPLATIGTDKFIIDNVIFADSSFFDVFTFPVISGNPRIDMAKPHQAYLTSSLAAKIYGNQNPLGRTIRLRNKIDVEVVGIIEDIPSYSHVRFDMVVSAPSYTADYMGFDLFDLTSWDMTGESYAYVKLHQQATVQDVENQLINTVKKYYDGADEASRSFHLQPLIDIHFNQVLGSPTSINPTSLWVLAVVGLFIVVVACVNFINLATALAVKRSKEIGVRKTLGAGRGQLIRQYLADTFIVTTVSALLALGIAERVTLLFNQYFQKELVLDFTDVQLISFLVLTIVVVSLLSGLYPAIVLSGYNPVKALKSNIHSQSAMSLFLRKGLIIFQFFISQVLIIATIVIANQMDYFMSKPMGFDKDAIILTDLPKNDDHIMEKLANRLREHHAVKEVSFALEPPLSDDVFTTRYRLSTQSEDVQYSIQVKPADVNYLTTYGIKLKYGRWFTAQEAKEGRGIFTEEKPNVYYVINETAAHQLGFSNPEEAMGVNITTGINSFSAPVIGIVEDYHLGSFHEEIMPVVMMPLPMFYYKTGIKVSMKNLPSTIEHIESVYTDAFPENLFDYKFLDDEVQEFYVEEQRTFLLFKIFSGISIFISCLGLLGLISFIINQRTKEVGIRKVLGAGVSSVIGLFSKDFMILVVVAFALSAPVAWYIMDIWLSEFAYKIDMEIWFYVLAIAISALITFFTIGYQSYRAAISNPVNALRDE